MDEVVDAETTDPERLLALEQTKRSEEEDKGGGGGRDRGARGWLIQAAGGRFGTGTFLWQ